MISISLGFNSGPTDRFIGFGYENSAQLSTYRAREAHVFKSNPSAGVPQTLVNTSFLSNGHVSI